MAYFVAFKDSLGLLDSKPSIDRLGIGKTHRNLALLVVRHSGKKTYYHKESLFYILSSADITN